MNKLGWNTTACNIGYMTLTCLLGLVGAFSHDRYHQLTLIRRVRK